MEGCSELVKELVLKTSAPKGLVGSSPTPSATNHSLRSGS